MSFTFVSVLKRPVSTEELQEPGGPYIKKTFTVNSFYTLQRVFYQAEVKTCNIFFTVQEKNERMGHLLSLKLLFYYFNVNMFQR